VPRARWPWRLADPQKVQADQKTVAKDEAALATALGSTSSSTSSASTGGSSSSSATHSSTSPTATGTSGATSTPTPRSWTQTKPDRHRRGALVRAQQSLADAQLTSPIAGTVASVGIAVGDSVSADSSTSTIVIVGQNSYEVAATLTSAQAAQVNVGNKAVATVDGTSRSVPGSVVQVGPVAVSSAATRTRWSWPACWSQLL